MVGVTQMGVFLFTYRHHSIISQKSDINKKLLDLRKRQMDLQSYSSAVADGSVSMNDLMSAPPTMFSRMLAHMSSSHQQAMVGAQNGLPGLLAMAGANGMFANLQPQMQEQYKQMMFKNLYDKEREKFARQEEKILSREDKRIEQQVAQLTTQLQMLEAEEKNIVQAEAEEAKNSAPKFGL